jgi:hypothetical protein
VQAALAQIMCFQNWGRQGDPGAQDGTVTQPLTTKGVVVVVVVGSLQRGNQGCNILPGITRSSPHGGGHCSSGALKEKLVPTT